MGRSIPRESLHFWCVLGDYAERSCNLSLSSTDLLAVDDRGLRCEAGRFHIDPWRPVEHAVITHAHADHARPGSGRYWCAEPGLEVAKRRLGAEADIVAVPYGQPFDFGHVRLSFHPAGHVLGSAQVRVESSSGGVWVAAGDYKRAYDPTCAGFEPVPCDVFITEATFALPVYRFPTPARTIDEIVQWWCENAEHGRVSVLFCYALGKAQRLLAELHARAERLPQQFAWVHGATNLLNGAYAKAGVDLLPTRLVSEHIAGQADDKPRERLDASGHLVLAPPSAAGSPWMRRFGAPAQVSTGFASGWMHLRGIRRRRRYDRGFVLSDHADWPDLIRTITETGCRRVLATHGSSRTLARYLQEQGLDAAELATPYETGSEDE